ncbi:hypothetical protein GUJ93_ZPchr0013g34874 [Zizania palustris]|uniref:Secreted protein n=1 Tax=Zizania palustris TaxID=103762 RepID=A0A8J5WZW0_ZIZPA|nr:hypothetical protein GUJ93_ZPchr0013g34874 [Zizania palustris]
MYSADMLSIFILSVWLYTGTQPDPGARRPLRPCPAADGRRLHPSECRTGLRTANSRWPSPGAAAQTAVPTRPLRRVCLCTVSFEDGRPILSAAPAPFDLNGGDLVCSR